MSISAAELLAIVGVRGADEAALKLVRVGAAADSAGVQLATLATVGTVLAGAGLVALGVHAVKSFGDFQQGVTQLVTSAGEFSRNTKLVSAGMLQMSVDTATSTDKLEKGMFNVESATYHGADGLKVLKAAAEGAKAENSDLAQATDVLTTTMHGLHASSSLAVPIMNSLIATVADGKMHMDDLTGAMKNVLPVSSSLHIHLSDVEGALATMAAAGDRGSSAGTHLAMMFKMLENPASTASKEMKAMGIDSVKLAETMSTSLPDALKMIQDAVAQHFTPGSVEYERAIAKILGGSKSGIAGLELLGQNFKDLEKNTNDAAEALKKGGKDVENWALIQQNLNFKLDAAKNAVEALAIKAGSQLAPILSKLLDQVTPLITQFGDWIDKNNVLTNAFNTTVSIIQNSINFYNQWKGVIQNTAIALTVFFTPALIKAGVEAVISAAKITYNFVASLILTGAEGWAAAGKLAVYIGALIATGYQAVIAAAKVTFSFIASLIATASAAYASAFAVTGSFVPALGLVGIQALLAAGKLLAGLIPALYATGVAATAALGPIGLIIAAVGLATVAFAAMKHQSDVMNLGVSGAFDTMGDKVQRSTGRIIATADQMKQRTSQSATEMQVAISNSIATAVSKTQGGFDSMSFWVRRDSGEMSDTAKRIFGQLVKDVKGDWSQLDQATKDYWNGIAAYIDNKSGLAAAAAQRHFDSIHMPNLTGGQFGTISHLAGNAEGTDNWRGGLTWVGEKGPEILNLPRGSQIIPNHKIGSTSMGGGSAPVIHNHIDVYLDGTRMTGQLMPRIVQHIRTATGARI